MVNDFVGYTGTGQLIASYDRLKQNSAQKVLFTQKMLLFIIDYGVSTEPPRDDWS